MASYDNEYRPGGFSLIPPVIKTIILANVAIFLFQMVTSAGYGADASIISQYGALWSLGSGNFEAWQLVTYMFLHGGFWHIFFNMLILWMFGAEIENHWGGQQFATFYFVCGIGAGVLNLLLTSAGPTVGASGAIYGVLLAFGMMFPDRYIYIYFLLPVKAKYLVALYAVIEFFSSIDGRSDGVAHFAHLGGMIVGYVYIKVMQREWPLQEWFKRTFPQTAFQVRTEPKVSSPKLRMDKVDEILDKISRTGYESLTSDEKRILLEASKDKS